MPDAKTVRTWTLGVTTGLVAGGLLGGLLAAATASSPTASKPEPCPPVAAAVAAAPAATVGPAAPAHPAPKAGSARSTSWTERPTMYASGDHLWFSWRSSMVRWLGGRPVPTAREQHASAREGWWGEAVSPAPSALAHVASER